MYLSHSLNEGFKILALDKKVIKKTAREVDLEEIFLSTLFLNYLIVLVVYLLSLIVGGFTIDGRVLNPNIFYAMILIYPFAFNLLVYIIYGLFGFVAELLNEKNHIKPLLSVGFHTAIVYSMLFYVIFLMFTFNVLYGTIILAGFVLYFIVALFSVLKTVYKLSGNQIAIVIFLPFAFLGLLLTVVVSLFPELVPLIGEYFFR